MKRTTITQADRILDRGRVSMLLPTILLLLTFSELQAQSAVSYYVYGEVTSRHQTEDVIESTVTSSIPGLIPPEPTDAVSDEGVPLPGVTVEVYNARSGILLGRGHASREGYYTVNYNVPEADHQVRFQIFLDFADGSREFVGMVDSSADGQPITVNSRLFPFTIEVRNASAVRAGMHPPQHASPFAFTEIGDIDVDEIYHKDVDGPSERVGLTKSSARLGPDLAFGGGLEIYAGFGGPRKARHYRIRWTNQADGSTGIITSPLYKKNYLFTKSGVEVQRVRLGPDGFETNRGRLPGGYRLDENLVGEPISDHPEGLRYSPFWTELGLRARWDTGEVPADGPYVLSIEAWDAAGKPIPSTDGFARIYLRVTNEKPQAQIHSIHYLGSAPGKPGPEVLNDSSQCQAIALRPGGPEAHDDRLQFKITAYHSQDLLREYYLAASHGHSQNTGRITEAQYISTPAGGSLTPLPGLVRDVVDTPATLNYRTCAYRFHLRVIPRISNGYYLIHIREDNWYAAISVLPPP